MVSSDETFYSWNGLASVVDPELGRRQQISIEKRKVVGWTEETKYHFRFLALGLGHLEFCRGGQD